MRYGILAAAISAFAMMTPAMAAKHHSGATPASASAAQPPAAQTSTAEPPPTFDDCFRLAWVRGVHVERFELDSFNEDCLANRVPFDSGFPVTTIQRSPSPVETHAGVAHHDSTGVH